MILWITRVAAAGAILWALLSLPIVWRLFRHAFTPHSSPAGGLVIGHCLKCARPIYNRDFIVAHAPKQRADFEGRTRLLSHARCPV